MKDTIIYPVDVHVILMSNQNHNIQKLDQLIDNHWIGATPQQTGGRLNKCRILVEPTLKPFQTLNLPRVPIKPLEFNLKFSKSIPFTDYPKDYYQLLQLREKNRDHKEALLHNTMRMTQYDFTYLINSFYPNYRHQQFNKKNIIPVPKFSKNEIVDYIELITRYMLDLISPIEHDQFSDIYIMDLTEPTTNWEKQNIRDRLTQYTKTYMQHLRKTQPQLSLVEAIYITASDNLFKTIKNIKKLNKTNNLTIITGAHSYAYRKLSYAVSEQFHYHIFFAQIYTLLNIQSVGASFIMYFLNFNTPITQQLFYILTMYYEECYVVKGLVDSNSSYFVGKKFRGIKQHELDKLTKIYKKLNKEQSKHLNIKDPAIRKKLHITKKQTRWSIYKYLDSFLKTKPPKKFMEQLDRFAKKSFTKEIETTILTEKLVRVNDCKKMPDYLDQVREKQIEVAIQYCQERGIPMSHHYQGRT